MGYTGPEKIGVAALFAPAAFALTASLAINPMGLLMEVGVASFWIAALTILLGTIYSLALCLDRFSTKRTENKEKAGKKEPAACVIPPPDEWFKKPEIAEKIERLQVELDRMAPLVSDDPASSPIRLIFNGQGKGSSIATAHLLSREICFEQKPVEVFSPDALILILGHELAHFKIQKEQEEIRTLSYLTFPPIVVALLGALNLPFGPSLFTTALLLPASIFLGAKVFNNYIQRRIEFRADRIGSVLSDKAEHGAPTFGLCEVADRLKNHSSRDKGFRAAARALCRSTKGFFTQSHPHNLRRMARFDRLGENPSLWRACLDDLRRLPEMIFPTPPVIRYRGPKPQPETPSGLSRSL
jgi:hypothetical protein